MDDALTWTAPGPGDWWLVREHFPQPMSRMLSVLFPPVTNGWKRGAARYGLATGGTTWGAVNGWIYYGPEVPLTQPELDARETAAQATLTSTPWRDEVREWHEFQRPQVVAGNLALQAHDPAALDDDALATHFRATVDNYLREAPLHFEHVGFDVVAGRLFDAGAKAGVEPPAISDLLAGASPATAAVDAHVQRLAEALDRSGAAAPIGSLDELRAAGPDVAAALDAYLGEYGWRPVAGHDVSEPTIGERPQLVLATVNARRRRAAVGSESEPRRGSLPPPGAEQDRFEELLVDARASYALRDDDVGVCWNWPLGLIRRGALEIGARCAARGQLADAQHIFEAEVDEALALLAGGGPASDELAERWDLRVRAGAVDPPLHLDGGGPRNEPLPKPPTVARLTALRDQMWSAAPERVDAPLHGIGIGTEPATGSARLVRQVDELSRLEDGDILVAVTTTTAFNAVFPLLAGVVTQYGGLFSHTALLARELGTPAVVGVADVFDRVQDGDTIEVDPAAGTVRVLA